MANPIAVFHNYESINMLRLWVAFPSGGMFFDVIGLHFPYCSTAVVGSATKYAQTKKATRISQKGMSALITVRRSVFAARAISLFTVASAGCGQLVLSTLLMLYNLVHLLCNLSIRTKDWSCMAKLDNFKAWHDSRNRGAFQSTSRFDLYCPAHNEYNHAV